MLCVLSDLPILLAFPNLEQNALEQLLAEEGIGLWSLDFGRGQIPKWDLDGPDDEMRLLNPAQSTWLKFVRFCLSLYHHLFHYRFRAFGVVLNMSAMKLINHGFTFCF